MRQFLRVGLIVLFAVGLGAGVAVIFSDRSTDPARDPSPPVLPSTAENPPTVNDAWSQLVPQFGDGFVEDSGYEVSLGFSAPLKDRRSLVEARDETRDRARR